MLGKESISITCNKIGSNLARSQDAIHCTDEFGLIAFDRVLARAGFLQEKGSIGNWFRRPSGGLL